MRYNISVHLMDAPHGSQNPAEPIYLNSSKMRLSSAESGIVWDNLINTRVAEALASCRARTSANILLLMLDKQGPDSI